MKKIFSSEIVKLIAAMLIASIMVLLPYFYIFCSPQLSRESSDWGNFGSYVNGLLSPILLFLTIVYLARTLRAQIDAQTAQKEDLSGQMELIKIANKNQQLQIKELEKANDLNQIMNHRTELIKYINNAVVSFTNDNTRLHSRWEEISKQGTVNDNEIAEIKRISVETLNNYNKIINLNNLALVLVLDDFQTVDELKEKFKVRWEEILTKYQ